MLQDFNVYLTVLWTLGIIGLKVRIFIFMKKVAPEDNIDPC